jgi:polyvinyl alcohol dehydrogenase (cytochrome)
MSGVASGENAIWPATAPALELLWKRELSGPVASSPTVVDGHVFVGDWSGREWALEAATGNLVATADLGTTAAPQCNPGVIGITSSATSDGGLLFLAGGDDGFYALDPATLATVWRVSLGDNGADGGYYGWCSPAIAGGVVLQGVSSNCDDPFVPGRLVALDESSGRIVAAADLTPPGVVGSGVWTSPSVDLAARKIFVTTASATHLDDGYAFSVLRLDLATLAVEDAWRLDEPLAPEADYDWGSSPTLFTAPDGRKLLGAGQKNGSYYAFDRENIQAGPVWSTPICRDGGIPQAGQGTLSTAAFDGTRLYMGGGSPLDSSDPNILGTLTALDPSDGHVLWRQTFSGPVIAPVSYANGVVFSTAGRLAFGLDAATGAILWSFETAGACFGGIAISHGRIVFGDLTGTLYCFSIPQ